MYRHILTLLVLVTLLCPAVQAQSPSPSPPPGTLGFVWLQRPMNPLAPSARGLVGWWRVLRGWAGGQTWYALTGLAHGTLTNMTTVGTSGWGGTTRPGGAGEVRFGGTDDYVTTNNTTLANFTTQDFSVMFWIKPTSLGVNETMIYTGTFHVEGWEIQHNGGGNGAGQLTFLSNQAGTTQEIETVTGLLSVGAWSCVVFTRAGSVGTFYHNGLPVSYLLQQSLSNPLSSTKALQFGRDQTDGLYIAAAMDDIRIYNRAVSASEAAGLCRDSAQGDPVLLTRVFPNNIAPTPPAIRGRFFQWFGPVQR